MQEEKVIFCFDRSSFAREGFSAQTVLKEAVERGFSLERIRDDLRSYLKIIQNNMIDLINQDYARFVQLSSNVFNLRDPMDKLAQNVQTVAAALDQSDAKSKTAELSAQLALMKELSSKGEVMHERLMALHLLQRIKGLLHAAQSSRLSMVALTREIVEARQLLRIVQNPETAATMTQCLGLIVDAIQSQFNPLFSNAVRKADRETLGRLFSLYLACECVDALRMEFSSVFVDVRLKNCLESEHPFQSVLVELSNIREQYKTVFAGMPTGFLEDCLLKVLMDFTQQHLKSVFIPVQPSEFRHELAAFCAFAEEFAQHCSPSLQPSTAKLLSLTLSKFDVQVYHQLLCLEVLASVDQALTVPFDFRATAEDHTYYYKAHRVLCAHIESIWSDQASEGGIFHISVAWSCLTLTFRIMNKYRSFLMEVGRAVQADLGQLNLESTDGPVSVAAVIRLVGDACRFKVFLAGVYEGLIGGRLMERSLSGKAQRQAVDSAVLAVERCIGDLVDELLGRWLRDALLSHWAKVSELPRLYRWTRKESPTAPSAYMTAGCELLMQFYNLAKQDVGDALLLRVFERCLNEVVTVYADSVGRVLNSVDQVSSSLSKLRGGKTTAADMLSDDEKIKLQLRLDLDKAEALLAGLPLLSSLHVCSKLSTLVSSLRQTTQ